ncbi:proteinase-activated receptor 3 [Thalassophryne amazonica]|uniref:proteinase-activated receptor 3 n=1 Tax=Thalassophryne amazonica TaxID=390379 RepID=UPI001471FF7A|nr:proteinase-activated receptor 3 [Thalassophryne amazonica]
MADLIPGLLICLMALQTFQHDETEKTENTSSFSPKTFKGKTYKLNKTNRLLASALPSTIPHLLVTPESPVTAYTTGILSTWIIPSSYILTMLVGIPSNAYILALLRVRLAEKSLSTILLYLNLALSDLLLLLSLALRVHYHVSGNNWIFGEIPCRLITALFYGNVYCSAQTIACISVKRYLAVVRPFLYRRLSQTALAVWTCFILWILFGAAVAPELLVRQSYHIIQLGVTTCHDVLPLEESTHFPLMPYRLTLVCVGFLMPFFICIGVHVAVVYHLRQSGCDWRPFIRVTTLVFIIFMVCFSPSGILHITHYINLLSILDDRLYGYYRLAMCLCCFHSCLDPFLCILMSKTIASEVQFISLHRVPQRPAVLM